MKFVVHVVCAMFVLLSGNTSLAIMTQVGQENQALLLPGNLGAVVRVSVMP